MSKVLDFLILKQASWCSGNPVLVAVFPLRFGQVQNCPNRFGLVQICPKELPKLAQKCVKIAQSSSVNLPKRTRTLPKLCTSLSRADATKYTHYQNGFIVTAITSNLYQKSLCSWANCLFMYFITLKKGLYCSDRLSYSGLHSIFIADIYRAIRSKSRNGAVA